jgi:hypothetical protein
MGLARGAGEHLVKISLDMPGAEGRFLVIIDDGNVHRGPGALGMRRSD